jgi:hypothetical protein
MSNQQFGREGANRTNYTSGGESSPKKKGRSNKQKKAREPQAKLKKRAPS